MLDERPPELIETERLELRRYKSDFVPAVVEAIESSSFIADFQGWVFNGSGYYTSDEWQRANIERWESATAFVFTAFAEDRFVGCFDYRHTLAGPVEFGYWLRHDETRKGFAFEACAGMLRAAFELQRVTQIEAHTDIANIRSKNLLTKLGLTFTGEMVENPPPSPGKIGAPGIDVGQI